METTHNRDKNGRNSWLNIAQQACDHAGIQAGSIEVIVTWDQLYCANAIYRLGNRQYLKIFGPDAEWQFHLERTMLNLLEKHQSIPAPRLVTEGYGDGLQPYIIMTAVPGKTAQAIWDELSRPEQLAIARELGSITADIHRLPLQNFQVVEQVVGSKARQIQGIMANRVEQIIAAEKLTNNQRDKLLTFLSGEALAYISRAQNINHYDLAHNHVFLVGQGNGVKVSGIIDWGEAILGPPEWDIVYLWFWTFSGDRRAMQECLRALYGVEDRPDDFARRCLAAVLYTPSMGILWHQFLEKVSKTRPIVEQMIDALFPAEVFDK